MIFYSTSIYTLSQLCVDVTFKSYSPFEKGFILIYTLNENFVN